MMLESVWATSAEFLGDMDRAGDVVSFVLPLPRGRDLVPGARPGDVLAVTLRLLDREAEFLAHPRVASPRDGDEAADLRLEFVAEESDRLEVVFACARGTLDWNRRRGRARVACRVPAVVRLASGEQRRTYVVNLSDRGAHLAFADAEWPPPDLDARLDVAIAFPEEEWPLMLTGRVACIVGDGPQRGAGVEFQFADEGEREQLGEHVAARRTKRAR